MYERRTEIMQNVFLTYLPASKFKTSVLSAHLVTPLSKETASANALLPAVLRRGTMRCPDTARRSIIPFARRANASVSALWLP